MDLKGALAKVFVKKTLCLNVEEKVFIKYITLKHLILKNISIGMHLKRGINVYLIASK